ncbi:MAG: DUF2452 domain-containing protein [Polyangiales bacterium]
MSDSDDRPSHALSPYPTSRLAPAFSLVDVASEIARADETIARVTEARLEVIARQMQALREEAERILARAREDAELHRARCTFVRRPGHVYHLYRRDSGELYFSLLSPTDWGHAAPHPFVGSYRLEADMSFTRTAGPGLEPNTLDARPEPRR